VRGKHDQLQIPQGTHIEFEPAREGFQIGGAMILTGICLPDMIGKHDPWYG
jgi:hypothetical protein